MPWTKSNNEKFSRFTADVYLIFRKSMRDRTRGRDVKSKGGGLKIRRLLSVLSSVDPRSAGTAQKSGPNNRGGGGGKFVRRLLRTPDFRNVFRSCLPLSASLFPSVFCPPAFVRPSLFSCFGGVIRRTVRLFFARRTNRGCSVCNALMAQRIFFGKMRKRFLKEKCLSDGACPRTSEKRQGKCEGKTDEGSGAQRRARSERRGACAPCAGRNDRGKRKNRLQAVFSFAEFCKERLLLKRERFLLKERGHFYVIAITWRAH